MIKMAILQAILEWGIGLLPGLREEDRPNDFDRIAPRCSPPSPGRSFCPGRPAEARETLIKARELAAFFDASPGCDEMTSALSPALLRQRTR